MTIAKSLFYKIKVDTGRGSLCLLTCLIGMSSFVSTPAISSPVMVYECQVLLPQNPLPIDSLDLKYTVRRHFTETTPVENTETSLWSQAKFENSGTFELDIYPLEGSVRKEFSTGTFTTILDGAGAIRDELEDIATGTTEVVEYEGFVVESVSLIFVKSDGSAWSDHLIYPEITDPAFFNTAACLVEWRAPGDGAVCQVPGGGSTLCRTGIYIGVVRSIRTEDHDGEHGATLMINSGINDAWVSADAAKQGMFITVFPDSGLMFLAWFTFDTVAQGAGATATFGAPGQRWATAVGSFNKNKATLTAELTTGGVFNSNVPLPVQQANYGTIDLDFINCDEAIVNFEFPSTGESGQFTINRALPENKSLCEALGTQ